MNSQVGSPERVAPGRQGRTVELLHVAALVRVALQRHLPVLLLQPLRRQRAVRGDAEHRVPASSAVRRRAPMRGPVVELMRSATCVHLASPVSSRVVEAFLGAFRVF